MCLPELACQYFRTSSAAESGDMEWRRLVLDRFEVAVHLSRMNVTTLPGFVRKATIFWVSLD